MADLNLTYTLCFLTRGDAVLMLHRAKAPNRGLWNGVGGRIEAGESPAACILREIEEETGYRLARTEFRGILTWEGFEVPAGGLYLFTAEAPEGEPVGSSEGLLAWKPRAWVFSSAEVVSNIPLFAPLVLGEAPAQTYHFIYDRGLLVGHRFSPLLIEPHTVLKG
jgi:8-oxo-dGTP diphosphatase